MEQSSPQANNPVNKQTDELYKRPQKRRRRVASKHLQGYSPSLASREMQVKTVLRGYTLPVGIKTINGKKNWQGQEK